MLFDKAGGRECDAGTDVRERGRYAVELQGTYDEVTAFVVLVSHNGIIASKILFSLVLPPDKT